MRDYAPLYEYDVDLWKCKVCGERRTLAGQVSHGELHLAAGEALVENTYVPARYRVHETRVERVIPMPTAEAQADGDPEALPGEARVRAELRELHVRIAREGLKRSHT